MNQTPPPQHRQASVTESLDNSRLDFAMAALFSDFSRSMHKQWIIDGQVKVNGKVCTKPRQRVTTEQIIEVCMVVDTQTTWQAEAISLDIIHEDDHLIVVNKPAGLVTHPGAGNQSRTLVNALLHHCPDAHLLPRAGIIHRLDKDTSGLLLAAKTHESFHALTNAMQAREIQRSYEAIAEGTLIAGNTIDAPIARHHIHRTKMAVVSTGKPAVTHYRIIEKFKYHTHVSVSLETGRTHQIRVHFKHIKHPLVGDRTYNPRRRNLSDISHCLKATLDSFPRQALHARQLTLTHPNTHEFISWQAPIPDDMCNLIAALQENEVQQ